MHLRSDDHKETGGNQTYKINFTQLYKNFKFGLTHSTGLKNPSLYELYGSSSTHSGSRAIDPEKVKQMNYMQNTLLLKISILFQLFIEQI